ncbi:hypothetical protein K1T71_007989 [Dendrolimus kikuchii]|uniref:Uncharacterized protein n=1 Tax=Dendrolimus kikuchii TaxID=765133 RepID=A0ACC1CZ94_9NEOP|nr:hypothetical protein K1T71_007989 [Dendrolimus kikuchii]
MCSIRAALFEDDKKRIIDVIVDFHLNWLHTINEIENFKKLINDLPREDMYQAISYTIDAMGYRIKYYQKYMENIKYTLSNVNQANLLMDMEIVEDMHKEVTRMLLERLKCFRNYTSINEFILKVNDATEELLIWIDKISDNFAKQLTSHVNLNTPHLSGDLTKTLQQIVDDFQSSQSPSALKIIDELKSKGHELSTMIRCTTGHSLEISKVVEKIQILEDRIKRLESGPSLAAVMALTNKKEFLEQRLASLENLKVTLKSLHQLKDVPLEEVNEEEFCICEDFFQFRVFNHSLPLEEREKLVTELCYLWDLAVFGERSRKSVISILSAGEMKEEFTDDLGTFYFDEYSRKIYKLPGDDTLYQQNERNKLVPLCDDTDHIYYYDDCGRYFIDTKTRQRVYKAHATASEYMMDSTGVLLKVKEERDGIVYYYDNYGRYYINDDGKHIYREPDTTSEYENDGLGNLVRIRSYLDIFKPCPDDAHVTEDCKYLKQTVGDALRVCIADVILQQPADPIKCLSVRLLKYRENMELKEKRLREKEELNVEREIIAAEEKAAAERAALEAALLTQGGSEASYDSNLLKYRSMHQDDQISVGASSK